MDDFNFSELSSLAPSPELKAKIKPFCSYVSNGVKEVPTHTTEGRPASRPYWTFWKTDAPGFWMNSRGIPIFPPETLASPSSFLPSPRRSQRQPEPPLSHRDPLTIGGCINQASRMTGKDGRNFFVKQNGVDFHNFFEAEAEALMEIEATSTVAVPEVIVSGLTGKSSFLVLSLMEEGPDSPPVKRHSELNWRGFTQSSNPISVGTGTTA